MQCRPSLPFIFGNLLFTILEACFVLMSDLITPLAHCNSPQMLSVVLAALLGLAAARPQAPLPAGLSAAACPNYPFCGLAPTPADFPTPVVNGQ